MEAAQRPFGPISTPGTFAPFLANGRASALMRCIIMKCEHIVPYKRMRLARVLFSQSGASYLMRLLAGCTTNTFELSCRYSQARASASDYEL